MSHPRGVPARQDRRPRPQPVHRATHAQLLRRVPGDAQLSAPVDAIVVPTGRPAAYLRTAMAVARQLGCPLLALCSKYAKASEVMAEVVDGSPVIAVDIVEGDSALPAFRTSQMLAGGRFARKADTSLKRNVGLAVARMAGWRHIVFLDDDIAVDDPADLTAAAALLSGFDAVGLENGGFPDNSVVCHGRRAVGEPQGSFIGGGALAVPAQRVRSFFPNIYNEDWFFLLGRSKLSSVAVTGRVVQKPFDPFSDPRRARSEELGDCLAEGVYALLDQGRRVQDADDTYWKRFLEDRGRLISGLLERVPRSDRHSPEAKDRMVAALKAAQGRRELIEPSLCTRYLRAWGADRRRWQGYLGRLPSLPAADALVYLGFKPTQPDAYRSR